MTTLTDSNLKITLLILPHTNTATDGDMFVRDDVCVFVVEFQKSIVSFTVWPSCCVHAQNEQARFFSLDIKMKKSKITFIVFFIASLPSSPPLLHITTSTVTLKGIDERTIRQNLVANDNACT